MTNEIEQILSEEQPVKRSGGLSLASIVLLLGVLAAVGTVGYALLQQSNTQPTAGQAPDFTMTTFDGETFTLSDYRGEIIVLNFWGSWCAPCREEAPDLQRIHEDYQDRGVHVVGVTYLDTREDSLEFILDLGLTYRNGPDPRTEIAEDKYHIDGAPETFIIDQNGDIVYFHYGPITADQLADILEGLL